MAVDAPCAQGDESRAGGSSEDGDLPEDGGPSEDAGSVQKESEAHKGSAAEAVRLLLVEDETVIALAEAALLRRAGYDVVHASSGEAAVKTVAEDPRIALVLMDIDLGFGIDGGEAARLILAERELPVVFLTSHTEKEHVDRARGIVPYGYVTKDSGEHVLLSAIEVALRLFDANVKLQQERAKLREERELFISGPTVVFRWPVQAGHPPTYVSPNVTDLLGYTAEELQSGSITLKEIIHAEDLRRVRRQVERRAVTGKKRFVLEYRLIRRDGKPVEVRSHTSLVRARNRRPPIVLGYLQDISQERRKARALDYSYMRADWLREMARRSFSAPSPEPAVAYIVDAIREQEPDLRVMYATVDRQGRLTVQKSMQPKRFLPLESATIDLRTAPEYLAALRTGKTLVVEDVLQDARFVGGVIPSDAWGARAVLDVPLQGRGKLVGVISLHSDRPRTWPRYLVATMREIGDYLSLVLRSFAMWEQLRGNEERLRRAIDAGGLAWWEMELPSTRLVFDRGIGHVFGFPPERFKRYTDLLRLVHREDVESVRMLVERLRSREITRGSLECRVRRVDGSLAWVRVLATVSSVNDSGPPLGLCGMVEDITARKEAE